ncbi:uncharacterized protein LOC107021264 isoform X2 [Solanum pennellii]|uniref:Uncharacterized protein LOC107021264 isoform X2 n=1 Tax=Solanum pennellii TaxID=28526 RepID=A0ABM1VCV5_SOLPN|nr:uncharacterized protein LOC107021264 isoform X2 [Solanum pennellii]
MVSQRKSSASQPPTRKKRKKKSSSSSDDKPPSRYPKANDNDVDSPGKSVPIWEKLKEQYSIDRSKLCGNSSANDKVQAAGKVDGVAARKGVRSVTEGTEMKKPWCQLIAEFPQNSTVEIFEQCFMTVSHELRLHAPAVDDPDKLLANTLFEVVFNESRNSPFILLVKNADKVMARNSELYSNSA